MSITLPQAPDRRGALAWVALQNAPTPREIFINTDDGAADLWLNVKTLDELAAWATLLGATYAKPFEGSGGITLHTAGALINGWRCSIKAHIRATETTTNPLDDETRGQLQQLVDGDGAS